MDKVDGVRAFVSRGYAKDFLVSLESSISSSNQTDHVVKQ